MTHGEPLAVPNAGRSIDDCASVPGEGLEETRRLNALDPGRHFYSPLWEEYVRSLPPRLPDAGGGEQRASVAKAPTGEGLVNFLIRFYEI